MLAIATTARHSAQNIAFHEVGRQAIMADPKWNGGDYYAEDAPAAGLAVARMAAHITYLSEAALHRKFGRNLQDHPYSVNIWESTDAQVYYQQDKDWFYRAEERRWITMNDESSWRRIERVGGRMRRSIMHVA